MTGRRKETPCLLCQTGTYDRQAICNRCRQTYRAGRAAEAQAQAAQEAGHLAEFQAAERFEFHHFSGDASAVRYSSDGSDTIRAALLALVGAEEQPGYGGPLTNRALGMGRNFTGSRSTTRYLANPARWALAEQLVLMVQNLISHAYAQGKRDGEGFIMRIASGEVDFKTLLDRDARR